MSLIDYIKPLLKEGANLNEVEQKINDAISLTDVKVKEWITQPENKPTFDSIVGKAINTHIDKEKAERAKWEQTRSAELLEEAKKAIAKESQKEPWEIEMAELKNKLADKDAKEARFMLQTALQNVIKKDNLPIHSVDPFLQYNDDAENQIREFAKANQAMIDELVKKQINEKFGGKKMPGGDDKIDDIPVSPADFFKSQLERTGTASE